MPGIVRKDVDKAGGTLEQGSSNVFVNNMGAVTIGDKVKSHGRGKHSGANMKEGSGTVFVNGKNVSREGDKADCGHPATGSSNVSAG